MSNWIGGSGLSTTCLISTVYRINIAMSAAIRNTCIEQKCNRCLRLLDAGFASQKFDYCVNPVSLGFSPRSCIASRRFRFVRFRQGLVALVERAAGVAALGLCGYCYCSPDYASCRLMDFAAPASDDPNKTAT